VLAQAQVRLTTHHAIVANPAEVIGSEQLAVLAEAGMDQVAMDRFLSPDALANWPVGLRTDSARAANAGALRNYAAQLVARVEIPGGTMNVVVLPAMENLHMPQEMRSRTDLHLAVMPEGLLVEEPVVKRPRPSPGPHWKDLPQARIVKPDEVYASYDLGSDHEALAALERKGLSREEIEAVIFRCHQRNWPEAIDEFDKRYPKRSQLRRYKTYKAAQWDNKVLLVVPAEANRKLPEGLRPPLDIYMVYAAPGVSVKSK
jgi:hypothetical protein